MDNSHLFFCWSQLDRTTFPAATAQLLQHEDGPLPPRHYPGYPRFALPRQRPRWWPSLDQALKQRRSIRHLESELPKRRTLGRLLQLAHGISGTEGRGPTPSAGGLQALELYLVTFAAAWLPAGVYHYDRPEHALSQLSTEGERTVWRERVPSLDHVAGGALLWLLVGDGARVCAKYGARGLRFLLLEAGHLMQNLCLASTSLGLCTVPLGGYFEREVTQALRLQETDEVLYVGVCGQPGSLG